MGTHPIFESDFDCLTARLLRMTGIPGPANTPSKYPERQYNTRFRRRQTSEFEKYEKVTRATKIIEPKSIDEIKPKKHFLSSIWSATKWFLCGVVLFLAFNMIFIMAYMKYHGVQVDVFLERLEAATVQPRTVFDYFEKVDFTWIKQIFEQLMAKVDEWRELYEIDLNQVSEKWEQWIDQIKQKINL